MPIAAIIAMKPSLQQSTLVAVQRITGTVVGAGVAALFLLAVDNRTALEVIIVVLFALAMSMRTVSYTWYTAAMAGAILIAADIPHPSSLTDEGRRILWTLAGWGSPSSSCSWRTGSKSTPPSGTTGACPPGPGSMAPGRRRHRPLGIEHGR